MDGASFDFEALLRSAIIGLGAGLITAVIAQWIEKKRWLIPVLLGLGVGLIMIALIFYTWPSLVKVPNLENLSRAEAEQLLTKKGLIPEVSPQHVPSVEPGRVVPGSQDPPPGIKVRKDTVVRFAVSVNSELLQPKAANTEASPSVSFFEPKSGQEILCKRYGDGIYRFSVEGVSTGVVGSDLKLLLWVRPVSPPAENPGWYSQRPPINGISRVESNGSWRGVGQIGNAQWPPHDGDIIDIAVTVIENEAAKRLLARPGVVIETDLSYITSDKALGVRVRLK
jgi:hypothetical protein